MRRYTLTLEQAHSLIAQGKASLRSQGRRDAREGDALSVRAADDAAGHTALTAVRSPRPRRDGTYRFAVVNFA